MKGKPRQAKLHCDANIQKVGALVDGNQVFIIFNIERGRFTKTESYTFWRIVIRELYYECLKFIQIEINLPLDYYLIIKA